MSGCKKFAQRIEDLSSAFLTGEGRGSCSRGQGPCEVCFFGLFRTWSLSLSLPWPAVMGSVLEKVLGPVCGSGRGPRLSFPWQNTVEHLSKLYFDEILKMLHGC